VEVADKLVRFVRPGVTEEYSVSMDGVRQDFIIEQRPGGAGELALWLDVRGASIEPTPGGAQLVLENSGRKIAYDRLHVTDATGKELPARMDIHSEDEVGRGTPCAPRPADLGNDAETNDGAHGVTRPTSTMLAVVVDDTDAVYPVRIDPTFSDANWISMGGIPGADNYVYATAVDGSGNLYIGGSFTVAGDVVVNHIAKWDGNAWSALGSGMNSTVDALAVSGSDLYAGGRFYTAGESAANGVAKWNGSSWSALGSGLGNGYQTVSALAVSGSDLYAGGDFTTAGGTPTANVAKWNGSSWSALGTGMNGGVRALALSGSDLYAGGTFTMAGGKFSAYLAKAIVNPPVLAIEPDSSGDYFLRFSGVPDSAYQLQRAPSVTGPWATIASPTASGSGLVEFRDLFPPPGQGYYRSVQP
jgi:hypothetical protein